MNLSVAKPCIYSRQHRAFTENNPPDARSLWRSSGYLSKSSRRSWRRKRRQRWPHRFGCTTFASYPVGVLWMDLAGQARQMKHEGSTSPRGQWHVGGWTLQANSLTHELTMQLKTVIPFGQKEIPRRKYNVTRIQDRSKNHDIVKINIMNHNKANKLLFVSRNARRRVPRNGWCIHAKQMSHTATIVAVTYYTFLGPAIAPAARTSCYKYTTTHMVKRP